MNIILWYMVVIYMSRVDPQLKLRLPLELKDKITESAASLGRSINADVVARLEQSFDQAGVELRQNEMIIDKDLYKELIGMRKDLLKMSKLIYDGFAPKFEEIKILPYSKPTNKAIAVGDTIKLNFTFGESNNSRFGNFSVLEYDGEIGIAELIGVTLDINYFEDYEDRIGSKYKFKKNDVVDVKKK
ncbi:Arc family DNA-binding protein [Acinetobacter larvae]|nr:Arc family DNA-binding protein [Acinetobacter larvae]